MTNDDKVKSKNFLQCNNYLEPRLRLIMIDDKMIIVECYQVMAQHNNHRDREGEGMSKPVKEAINVIKKGFEQVEEIIYIELQRKKEDIRKLKEELDICDGSGKYEKTSLRDRVLALSFNYSNDKIDLHGLNSRRRMSMEETINMVAAIKRTYLKVSSGMDYLLRKESTNDEA